MSYVTVFIVESATEKYVNKLVASVTQMPLLPLLVLSAAVCFAWCGECRILTF